MSCYSFEIFPCSSFLETPQLATTYSWNHYYFFFALLWTLWLPPKTNQSCCATVLREVNHWQTCNVHYHWRQITGVNVGIIQLLWRGVITDKKTILNKWWMQIKLENNVLKTKINEARTCVSQSRKSVSQSAKGWSRRVRSLSRRDQLWNRIHLMDSYCI